MVALGLNQGMEVGLVAVIVELARRAEQVLPLMAISTNKTRLGYLMMSIITRTAMIYLYLRMMT
jgi:hypothetical protein